MCPLYWFRGSLWCLSFVSSTFACVGSSSGCLAGFHAFREWGRCFYGYLSPQDAFETESLSLSSPGWPELAIPGLWLSVSFTLCLLDAGITGVHHHSRHFVFLKIHSVHVCSLLDVRVKNATTQRFCSHQSEQLAASSFCECTHTCRTV